MYSTVKHMRFALYGHARGFSNQ